MDTNSDTLNARAQAFTQRLRTDHSVQPAARDVLAHENELGTGAIASQLTRQGTRLLFRALDLERKAKLRATKG